MKLTRAIRVQASELDGLVGLEVGIHVHGGDSGKGGESEWRRGADRIGQRYSQRYAYKLAHHSLRLPLGYHLREIPLGGETRVEIAPCRRLNE